MTAFDDSRQLQACLPGLRRYARALAGALHADDLVQDTVERAWRRRDQWQRDGAMRPWLFSIMHNLHVDQLRRPGLALQALLPLSATSLSKTYTVMPVALTSMPLAGMTSAAKASGADKAVNRAVAAKVVKRMMVSLRF